MSTHQARSAQRRQVVRSADTWSGEVINQLETAYDAALNSGFQEGSMIKAGLEELLDEYNSIPQHEEDHEFVLTKIILHAILPTRFSIYEMIAAVYNNFQGEEELGRALMNFLVVLENHSDRYLRHIDNNMQRIFTDLRASYNSEFDMYYYNHRDDRYYDTSSDDEVEDIDIEDFHENYQNLAPTTEAQLDRLKNELAITLCEEYLMPTKDQECDCWILQIEG